MQQQQTLNPESHHSLHNTIIDDNYQGTISLITKVEMEQYREEAAAIRYGSATM